MTLNLLVDICYNALNLSTQRERFKHLNSLVFGPIVVTYRFSNPENNLIVKSKLEDQFN